MDGFAPRITAHCCLCGSDQSLSGEHKIKASALRSEFGRESLVITRDGGGRRFAQSSGSKALHFSVPVCGECNSSRTQPADIAFDRFHGRVASLIRAQKDPAGVFWEPTFSANGAHALDIFRYFAKLLCCHLAEIRAPLQEPIADFAIGYSDHNCVLLGVCVSPLYAAAQAEYPDLLYAAHGGLTVLGQPDTYLPTGFRSTLTIGPAHYEFEAQLTESGVLQLAAQEPAFVAWCRQTTLRQSRSVKDGVDVPT